MLALVLALVRPAALTIERSAVAARSSSDTETGASDTPVVRGGGG